MRTIDCAYQSTYYEPSLVAYVAWWFHAYFAQWFPYGYMTPFALLSTITPTLIHLSNNCYHLFCRPQTRQPCNMIKITSLNLLHLLWLMPSCASVHISSVLFAWPWCLLSLASLADISSVNIAWDWLYQLQLFVKHHMERSMLCQGAISVEFLMSSLSSYSLQGHDLLLRYAPPLTMSLISTWSSAFLLAFSFRSHILEIWSRKPLYFLSLLNVSMVSCVSCRNLMDPVSSILCPDTHVLPLNIHTHTHTWTLPYDAHFLK